MLDAHKTVGREPASLPKMSQGKRNFREQLTAIHIFLLRTCVGKDVREKILSLFNVLNDVSISFTES